MNPGFKIEGFYYEWPQGVRLKDAPLVRELTGVPFDEFAELATSDILKVMGMMGIAVSQANPDWSRAKVCEYVGNVDMEALENVKGDVDEDPPAEGAAAPESPSPATSSESTSTPAASSEPAPV